MHQKIIEAALRFPGDTQNHHLQVIPVEPENQSFLFKFRGVGSSYWMNWFVGYGWMAIDGDMGSFIVRRSAPMLDWVSDAILRDNEYIQKHIVSGESMEHTEEKFRKSLDQIKTEMVDDSSWMVAIAYMETESLSDQRQRESAAIKVDAMFNTDLYANMPLDEDMSLGWAWYTVAMANIMDAEKTREAVGRYCSQPWFASREVSGLVLPGFSELEKEVANVANSS